MLKNISLITLLTFLTISCKTTEESALDLIDDTLGEQARLSSLELSIGTLMPDFNPLVLAYSVSLSATDSILNVIPKSSDSNVKIKVNDETISSGLSSQDIKINDLVTKIFITVTPLDTSMATIYTIVVNKLALDNLLEISGSWSGIDNVGDVSYIFSNAAWSTSRNTPATVAAGTVQTFDNSTNSLIISISAHTDITQIGKFHKMTWSPDNPSDSIGTTITFTVYSSNSSILAAQAETIVLLDPSTLTKE